MNVIMNLYEKSEIRENAEKNWAYSNKLEYY